MFNPNKDIKPREPVRVAEAPQPLDYDDIKPLEGDALKEYFLEIFRKREEESEDWCVSNFNWPLPFCLLFIFVYFLLLNVIFVW